MRRATVVYRERFPASPISFWVHRHPEGTVWSESETHEPPFPPPVPGRGWPQLVVEFDGVKMLFSSAAELDHVIEVMTQNPLPTTRRLSELRGTSMGPNRHWLSRLPARAKRRAYRERLVVYLEKVRPWFWS